MVVPILCGGAANQAFQTFMAIAYARKHNMPYAIPTHTSNPRWKHYRFGNVYYEDVNTTGFFHYRAQDVFYEQRPYDVSYHEIPYHENIILEGHFQSWKYWLNYIDEIRDILEFPYEFKENTISIHKRLGDYVSMSDKLPPVSAAYIASAINHFANQGYNKFIAFSDDQLTFKHGIASLYMHGLIPGGLCIEFSECKTDMEDLAKMSSCAHQIIANSSYSLLAYYLNRNPNKQVVAPMRWFGEGYGEVNVNDLYAPGTLVL